MIRESFNARGELLFFNLLGGKKAGLNKPIPIGAAIPLFFAGLASKKAICRTPRNTG